MRPAPRVFGYGSLVNLATHSYPDARPATLAGWQRVWRHTRLRPYAFLSVEPADAVIQGLSVAVPGGDWQELDTREAAYHRHDISARITPEGPTSVYQLRGDLQEGITDRHPALLSYLDVVVQGYARLGGAEAVSAFFATTTGWEGGVLDDRARPTYPRAQTLTPSETAMTDDMIRRHAIPVRNA